MTAYYNEIDPQAAAWLRELVKQGLIAPGEVDERDIQDISPADLHGFTQCHFFAGIGVWSYALRRASWPDDRPVWTGSCPCQPFSSAGKGGGFDDERHLWPSWYWLIDQCRPPVVFGEQVASKDAEPWLDLVQADLEAVDYALGAIPFPSAGVGAPHIRDRTYWVANSGRTGNGRLRGPRQAFGASRSDEGEAQQREWRGPAFGASGASGGLADDDDARLEGRGQPGRECGNELAAGPGGLAGGLANSDGRQRNGQPVLRGLERDGQDTGRPEGGGEFGARRVDSGLADTQGNGHERAGELGEQTGRHGLAHSGGTVGVAGHAGADGAGAQGEHGLREVAAHAGPVNGGWGNADWIYCRNGEWRPVEPSTFPLVDGASARVGRLRGYGNAINAEAARVFIESYLEGEGSMTNHSLSQLEKKGRVR